MNEKLTPEQFNQLVAEVDRLSRVRDAELDREQVKQILQELHLPTDHLDEALMQVRRREALAKERRRHRFLMVGLGLVFVGIAGLGSFQFHRQRQAIAAVYANPDQSRLTFERYDRAHDFKVIDRQGYPTIYYQVKLQQTPVGRQLTLGCNWTNPLGQLAHQNRYQTRPIEKNVWNTRCHQLDANSPPGTWRVEMFLGDRILSQSEFTVE